MSDDGPSPRRVPKVERIKVKVLLAAPGNARRKVKRLLTIADDWSREGYPHDAIDLCHTAAELVERIRSLHLSKQVKKRLALHLEQIDSQSEAS